MSNLHYKSMHNSNSSLVNQSASVLLNTALRGDFCTIHRGFHDYITITFCLLTSCFGYPLNGFAIVRLHRRSQGSQSRLTFLSISMLTANLMVLSFPCFGKAIWYITYYWYGRSLMCKMYKFLESTSVFFMSNVMISVAVDMLYAFKFPFSDGRKRVNRLVALSGVIALTLAIPQLYFWTTVSRTVLCSGVNSTISQCLILMPANDTLISETYAWFHLTVIFWVPLAFLIPCYTCVLILIVKQSFWHHRHCGTPTASSTNNSLRNYQTSGSDKTSHRSNYLIVGGSSFPPYSGCRRKKFQKNFRRSMRQAGDVTLKQMTRGQSVPAVVKKRFGKGIKMVMRVVGIYIVLWLPYEMAAMFQFFYQDFFHNYENYLGWLYLLYLTNTCINPFMHAVRNSAATPVATSSNLVAARTCEQTDSGALEIVDIPTSPAQHAKQLSNKRNYSLLRKGLSAYM